ncbi:MAG: PD-(D/E)XK nuclease family protein [Kofleriaceae bacterium]
MSRHLVISPRSELRLREATAWLAARPAQHEVLVVGGTADAAGELIRGVAVARGSAFGMHRMTLGRVAAELAKHELVERDLATVGGFPIEALCARVVQRMRREGSIGRLDAVSTQPGLPRALARTLLELRMAGAGDSRIGVIGARVAVGASEIEVALGATHVQVEHGGRVSEVRRELDDVSRALIGRAGHPELAAALIALEAELAAANLADRALVYRIATDVALEKTRRGALLDVDLVVLDAPVRSIVEQRLIAALVERAPGAFGSLVAGDERSARHLSVAFGVEPRSLVDHELDRPADREGRHAWRSIHRVQADLFTPQKAKATLDDSIEIFSAPGESRECVEIARRVLHAAERGVPFDRMAVLLRSPESYRVHLEEALSRANIPVHFDQGTRLPDPAGRAFLALLACADEELSARRFAEYISLGEVPLVAVPPPATTPGDRWVPPEEELLPIALAGDDSADDELGAVQVRRGADGKASDALGAVFAPWRWEELLVDASVIGGLDRWKRRLAGLEAELQLDDNETGRERRARQLADLEALRHYALPLIEELANLPTQDTWGGWIDRLGALASRALRKPERVQSVLNALIPMADVGPIELREVQLVLAERLADLVVRRTVARYGALLVASIEAARGRSFDLVFVPGLAERMFPQKIVEDPLLLDGDRARLDAVFVNQRHADFQSAARHRELHEPTGVDIANTASPASSAPRGAESRDVSASSSADDLDATLERTFGLERREDRLAEERLALRLAVGAATDKVVLSYPRIDLEQGRPRVPSFYGLEVLEAGEGELPGFDELGRRANVTGAARIGWPAPANPLDAIDEAEHDLALLDALVRGSAKAPIGAAHYLLAANPHLARALRARARRWDVKSWKPADGFIVTTADARTALAAHTPDARSFSPTALEQFAACPYRFVLRTIVRLEAREVPEQIETMNPLDRGSLIHDVIFRLMLRLRDRDLLPVRAATLSDARDYLDEILEQVTAEWHDKLYPAIERVWNDGVQSIRADLREWLRRLSEEPTWVPHRFELAFGLDTKQDRDPASIATPVKTPIGLTLRGSIDLVERRSDGMLRATDYKTGKAKYVVEGKRKETPIIAGGKSLQPVLYAMILEEMLKAPVDGGRLYYCTTKGDFSEVNVPLDDDARAAGQLLADTLAHHFEKGFFPAAPDKGECTWCDYRSICGPYEEQRAKIKNKDVLVPLTKLRDRR